MASAKEFHARWNKTQLGLLLSDEVMQPFVDDFRKQLREEVGSTERKLGITWDDIQGVTSNELSFSILERKEKDAALAITFDVTGRDQEAAALLAAVEKSFTARGGKKSEARVGDTPLLVFSAPSTESSGAIETVYFTKQGILCGIDDRAEAEAMVSRFAGNATDNLASMPAFIETMKRCKKEAGSLAPECRWFIEPFGFIYAERTMRGPRKRGQDLIQIFQANGYDAIQGIGGYVNLLVEGRVEYLVRTSIYAPPAKGKENDPLRWNLSMRMMQLPNSSEVDSQSWVPRMLASYSTINISLADAFDNVGPIFDAIQEHEDAWKNTLEGWTTDQYGPKVDVRKEFIGNMSNRLTIIKGYDIPITPESERSLFAIEATNEAALAKTLEKWMKNERDIKRREVGEFVIWERTSPDAEIPEVEVPGFTTVKPNSGGKKRERERVLPSAAATVALGHLMLASDVEYLTEVLQGFGQRERLASSADYQQVRDTLNQLALGERSAWAFGRGDEEIRPMFDLIRQNRMPESKSMMGKLLNNLLTTEADRKTGKTRKQRVDGSTLPEFEAVRRYLGPHGRIVRSDRDGWFVTGAVLNKEAP
ncbi:MAG: hypothetical protein IT425_15475 [Pirellulales bacterium]|nr:hypothetical protein [Pirellulales bacterium]